MKIAIITPKVLRHAAALVSLRGGMCVAAADAAGALEVNLSPALEEIYTASGEGPWEVDEWGYLLRFGGKRGLPKARQERATCLLRMADWLEREDWPEKEKR